MNGLPQGSALAPLPFNSYTNNQPIHQDTRSFIFADDFAVTSQSKDFTIIRNTLTDTLTDYTVYYMQNQLRPNPAKTQVIAFHLRKRDAAKHLDVMWDGHPLAHYDDLTYLGVTLDRMLTYKVHITKAKGKVSSRNAIIRKLTHSKWGADPSTICTVALVLSYLATEYTCPVWECSKHVRKLDSTLNKCCQIITGCLKPIRADHLHIFTGITPPGIKAVAIQSERVGQQDDTHHPMFQHTPEMPDMHSRRSFISSTAPLDDSASHTCTCLWIDALNAPNNTTPDMKITAVERLPDGAHLQWTIWKNLNHLRSQVGCCKINIVKWNYTTGPDTCDCGEQQTVLLVGPHLPSPVTADDLVQTNYTTLQCARH